MTYESFTSRSIPAAITRHEKLSGRTRSYLPVRDPLDAAEWLELIALSEMLTTHFSRTSDDLITALESGVTVDQIAEMQRAEA